MEEVFSKNDIQFIDHGQDGTVPSSRNLALTVSNKIGFDLDH